MPVAGLLREWNDPLPGGVVARSRGGLGRLFGLHHEPLTKKLSIVALAPWAKMPTPPALSRVVCVELVTLTNVAPFKSNNSVVDVPAPATANFSNPEVTGGDVAPVPNGVKVLLAPWKSRISAVPVLVRAAT
jgi:hypothetical protein